MDISKLPSNFRIEVTKEDLVAFAKALVESNAEATPKRKEVNDIIDFGEALVLTGYAKPTLYAKTGKGEIPHFKKGRKLFFRRSELIQWIEEGRRKTKKDLDELARSYLLKNK